MSSYECERRVSALIVLYILLYMLNELTTYISIYKQ